MRFPSCVFIMRLPSFMRLNYGVVVMLNERVNNYITNGPYSVKAQQRAL